MLARDAVITIIDFETTGTVAGFVSEPWQFGLVNLRSGVVDAATQLTGFIRIGERPFSPHAPATWMQHFDAIHSAPPLAQLWPVLHPRLNADAICGHAVGTEKKILRTIAPLHRQGLWIDTLKLVRLAFPDWPSHTLEDVAERLDLKRRVNTMCPGRGAHDALFDAVATAALLEHLIKLDGWQDATIESLAAARPKAYHAQLQRRR